MYLDMIDSGRKPNGSRIFANHSFSISLVKPADTAYRTNMSIAPTNETILLLKIIANAYKSTPAIIVFGIPKVMIPCKCPLQITSPYRFGSAHGIKGPINAPIETPNSGITAILAAPKNFPK